MKLNTSILLVIFLLVGLLQEQISAQPQSASEAKKAYPLTLKLLKARQYQQSVQMVFELQNRFDWLKHCWIGISFYDREGEFLYRELPLMYTSLPKDRSQRQELWLESTEITDVGTLVIRPLLLETALREQPFDTTLMKVVLDDSHDFRVIFESLP